MNVACQNVENVGRYFKGNGLNQLNLGEISERQICTD